MKIGRPIKLFALMMALALVAGCAAAPADDVAGGVVDAPDLPDATHAPAATDDQGLDQLPENQDDGVLGTPDGIPDPHEETPSEKLSYSADYSAFADANSDVVGWISVPNTMIEYPVVRTDDNSYYLHYNAQKEKSKSGAVFMDYRIKDFDSARHVIIYGHNMRNGTMFHDLNSYKYKDFFDQNPTVTLYYNGEKYEYQIFAAHVVLADLNFIRTAFDDDADFVSYFEEFKSYSKFVNDVTVGAEDQVLTLSTCTYEYDDSRFIVQAVRKK